MEFLGGGGALNRNQEIQILVPALPQVAEDPGVGGVKTEAPEKCEGLAKFCPCPSVLCSPAFHLFLCNVWSLDMLNSWVTSNSSILLLSTLWLAFKV